LSTSTAAWPEETAWLALEGKRGAEYLAFEKEISERLARSFSKSDERSEELFTERSEVLRAGGEKFFGAAGKFFCPRAAPRNLTLSGEALAGYLANSQS
jgi:hypothetical protein